MYPQTVVMVLCIYSNLKQEWRNELRRGDIVGVSGTPGEGSYADWTLFCTVV